MSPDRAAHGTWPYVCLALLAILGIAAFWDGGTLEREATSFITHYTGEQPLARRVFDPHVNDFGTYQARELSYFFDDLDAQLYAAVVAPIDRTFFIPPSAFVVTLLFALVFARGVRRTAPHLDPLTGLLVLACFLASFVYVSTMGIYYRSGKPLVALAILAYLFHVRRVRQARQAQERAPGGALGGVFGRDALIAFALALFAGLLDRQGAFYVLIGCGVLLVEYWLTRRLADVLLATCIAAAVLQAYNLALGPFLIHEVSGYWPSFEYQKLPLANVPSRVTSALRLLAQNACVMLGGSWPVTLCALAGAGLLVARARRRGAAEPRKPSAALHGQAVRLRLCIVLVLGAHVLMFALLIARHPYIHDWIDHRFWYYPLPWLAVLLYAVVAALDAALPALRRGERRLLQLVLAALLLGNLASLPGYRQLMLHGPWFGKIRAQTEWLKASMRSGVEDPRLEECYQSFRTRTDAWVEAQEK